MCQGCVSLEVVIGGSWVQKLGTGRAGSLADAPTNHGREGVHEHPEQEQAQALSSHRALLRHPGWGRGDPCSTGPACPTENWGRRGRVWTRWQPISSPESTPGLQHLGEFSPLAKQVPHPGTKHGLLGTLGARRMGVGCHVFPLPGTALALTGRASQTPTGWGQARRGPAHLLCPCSFLLLNRPFRSALGWGSAPETGRAHSGPGREGTLPCPQHGCLWAPLTATYSHTQ